MIENNVASLFHVKVLTPTKTLFTGEAFRISSENSVGPFDLYPHHANFISAISSVVTLQTPQETKTFQISSGIFRNFEQDVEIFVREDTSQNQKANIPKSNLVEKLRKLWFR